MLDFLRRKRSVRFGEIAVTKGLVTEKDISDAIALQTEYLEQHKIHKEIGAILAEKGLLTPKDVEMILREQKPDTGFFEWFLGLFNIGR
jgi:hypothetical protein